jgi:MFS family permease
MQTAANPAAPDAAARSPRDERRAAGVAGAAHALHDGYTDVVFVMLPVWQAEFGLGYAALGALRTVLAGAMASLQIPAGLLAERVGLAPVLAIGTALSGLGYILAGAGTGFVLLVLSLLLVGIGSSTQHPLAAALVAQVFSGPRRLQALGAYNFAGDVGKVTLPALATLLLTLLPWRPSLMLLGGIGLAAAAAIFVMAPRPPAAAAGAGSGESPAAPAPASATPPQAGFPLLLAIAVIDSATRMALLTFLPFLLLAKGASLVSVGAALTLVFAGGAAGKLVCAFIGARIGVFATVCLTEALTACLILALLPLPLTACLLLLPLLGVALNGTSSVLYGSVPLFVTEARRMRAFSIFYTGAIGSGAVAPALYGLLGDAVGAPVTVVVIALVVLITLPLAVMLRPAMARL